MSAFSRPIRLIGLILAIHVVALLSGWYEFHRWFDIPMHFAGGVAIGLLVLAGFEVCIDKLSFARTIRTFWQTIIYGLGVLGLVALVGVAWEWYEFIFDTIAVQLSANVMPAQMGLGDTMADLFLDLSGGLVAFLGWRKPLGK